MKLDITTNVADVVKHLDDVARRQIPFAAARALTTIAREVREDVQAEMVSVFDRPTPFTQRGLFVTPANKRELVATVGVMDRQAQYLRWQVEGGDRNPTNRATVLPSLINRNEFGNVNRRDLKKLIELAKAGKRVSHRGKVGQRTGVSSRADLFYGDPPDGRPAGLYKRVRTGARDQLIPLVIFREQAVKYRKRLDFYGVAVATVNRVGRQRFEEALAQAIATARSRA
ncbi:hypothetical protein [Caldimonas tepidiphila]|uniref:hypothetical protein n=1 Tax=Caldimonas tepidiphila TaxID=2315841 RepID=UPI000E5B9D78|nr:hypothetical protein [Caldimonas tepidiphila]